MVEYQIVILDVVGSSPICQPKHENEMKWFFKKRKTDEIFVLILVATWAVHYVVIPLFSHFF